MPILKVDAMGNLYTSSRDSEDGSGYGDSPVCVPQGDVTLGSAYLKAGAEQRKSLLKSKRDQEWIDNNDRKMAKIQNIQRGFAKFQERKLDHMNSLPHMKDAAIKKALAMGCDCDYSTAMSGNVMTANGQGGWDGMSRDQKTIHYALSGMGRDTSHEVDPIEAQQHREKIQAQRLLRLKARR
jgi:hypothetical protein